MTTVLRTFYIKRDVDNRLVRMSVQGHERKGALMVRLLEAGHNRYLNEGLTLPTPDCDHHDSDKTHDDSYVYRTLYVDGPFDDLLRNLAWDNQICKGQLLRWFMDLGLE